MLMVMFTPNALLTTCVEVSGRNPAAILLILLQSGDATS
jgi:hypothetical protein